MHRVEFALITITVPLLISSVCSAQKIETKIDKFTNQKRVSTDELLIINTKAKWPHLYISFRSVDSSYFITLHGENIAVGVIGPGDIAWLLLEDGSKATIVSTGLQDYDITSTINYYDHQYRIFRDDLEKLAQYRIVAIRKYYNNTYADIDIWNKSLKEKLSARGEEHAENARQLAKMFYAEVKK